MQEITQKHVDKILAEARGAKVPEESEALSKGATLSQAVSLSSFKSLWPKIRPYLLAAISVLQLFRRGDAAAGVAQAIAFIDMVTGGALPS